MIDMAPYFFCSSIPDAPLVELDADTSHHLAQVLRKQVGDALYLTDGAGLRLYGRLQSVSKKGCVLAVDKRDYIERSGRIVQVAISPIKNTSRLEWFVEKATELGVAHIITVLTDRTEKQRLRIDRLRQIAIAAMLQSQQVWLPTLEEPVAYESLIQTWADGSIQRLIAHCAEGPRVELADQTLSEKLGILIGPEGDFTEKEISLALAAGFSPVRLGPTRLRTETAGVAAAVWLRL